MIINQNEKINDLITYDLIKNNYFLFMLKKTMKFLLKL